MWTKYIFAMGLVV